MVEQNGGHAIGPSLPPGGLPRRSKGEARMSAVPEDPLAGIQLQWERPQGVGAGLRNLGNSCYLNSVLQCLTYTPPLANLALARAHSRMCPIPEGQCSFCLLERRLYRSLTMATGAGASDSPADIYQRISHFSKSFIRGRQEDAHELMRYAVEALHRDCMKIARGPPYGAALTESQVLALPGKAPPTQISTLFMGVLQNQVKCRECGRESNTLEPSMDLSLDLHGVGDLLEALRDFSKVEELTGANRYKCDKCKRLVDARKQMAIKQGPNVLCVHFKRFDGIFGGKIQRHVPFPAELDLAKYMSLRAPDTDPVYDLYGTLIHSGNTAHSGHYYAHVRDGQGRWHCMDDSSTSTVSREEVLRTPAYMLFYVRRRARALLPEHPTPAGAGSEGGRAPLHGGMEAGGGSVYGPARPPAKHGDAVGRGGAGRDAVYGPERPPDGAGAGRGEDPPPRAREKGAPEPAQAGPRGREAGPTRVGSGATGGAAVAPAPMRGLGPPGKTKKERQEKAIRAIGAMLDARNGGGGEEEAFGQLSALMRGEVGGLVWLDVMREESRDVHASLLGKRRRGELGEGGSGSSEVTKEEQLENLAKEVIVDHLKKLRGSIREDPGFGAAVKNFQDAINTVVGLQEGDSAG